MTTFQNQFVNGPRVVPGCGRNEVLSQKLTMSRISRKSWIMSKLGSEASWRGSNHNFIASKIPLSRKVLWTWDLDISFANKVRSDTLQVWNADIKKQTTCKDRLIPRTCSAASWHSPTSWLWQVPTLSSAWHLCQQTRRHASWQRIGRHSRPVRYPKYCSSQKMWRVVRFFFLFAFSKIKPMLAEKNINKRYNVLFFILSASPGWCLPTLERQFEISVKLLQLQVTRIRGRFICCVVSRASSVSFLLANEPNSWKIMSGQVK